MILGNYVKKKNKKKKKKNGELHYIQHPIDIGVCGVNLRRPTYRILAQNYFSCAEGVPKAIENTWKFVVFIVIYLILRFARSSAYYHAHTTDTWLFMLWIFWLSMQHCGGLGKGRKLVVTH